MRAQSIKYTQFSANLCLFFVFNKYELCYKALLHLPRDHRMYEYYIKEVQALERHLAFYLKEKEMSRESLVNRAQLLKELRAGVIDKSKDLLDQAVKFFYDSNLLQIILTDSKPRELILSLIKVIEAINKDTPFSIDSHTYSDLKETLKSKESIPINKLTVNVLKQLAEFSTSSDFPIKVIEIKYLPQLKDKEDLIKLTNAVEEIRIINLQGAVDNQFKVSDSATRLRRVYVGIGYHIDYLEYINKHVELLEISNVGHVNNELMARLFRNLPKTTEVRLGSFYFSSSEGENEFRKTIIDVIQDGSWTGTLYLHDLNIKEIYKNYLILMSKLKIGTFDDADYLMLQIIEKMLKPKKDFFKLYLEILNGLRNGLLEYIEGITSNSSDAQKKMSEKLISERYQDPLVRKKMLHNLIAKNVFELDSVTEKDGDLWKYLILKRTIYHFKPTAENIYQSKNDINQCLEMLSQLTYSEENATLGQQVHQMCVKYIDALVEINTADSLRAGIFFSQKFCPTETTRIYSAYAKSFVNKEYDVVEPETMLSDIKEVGEFIAEIESTPEYVNETNACRDVLLSLAAKVNQCTRAVLKNPVMQKSLILLTSLLQRFPSDTPQYLKAEDVLLSLFKNRILIVLEDYQTNLNLAEKIQNAKDLWHIKISIEDEFESLSVLKKYFLSNRQIFQALDKIIEEMNSSLAVEPDPVDFEECRAQEKVSHLIGKAAASPIYKFVRTDLANQRCPDNLEPFGNKLSFFDAGL